MGTYLPSDGSVFHCISLVITQIQLIRNLFDHVSVEIVSLKESERDGIDIIQDKSLSEYIYTRIRRVSDRFKKM